MECLLLFLVLPVLLVEGTNPSSDKEAGTHVEGDNLSPNIIIFLMDDVGYGDLSPYGHPTSNTPHIQKLADEGLLFTQFYTASPVCSPSRAALLTGRYQTRSGIYPGVFAPNDLGGLPQNETTIADGLREAGYSTGMVGKWHLGVGENGNHLPDRHGFDYYMGIPYTHDDCPCFKCFYPNQPCVDSCNPQYVPCPVFECKNGSQEIVQQPADLTTLSANLANAAVSFIKQKASKDTPFFLFYAFQHAHYPQFSGQKFRNSSVRGSYGDALREIDWSVGQVMQALKDVGVYWNTFVFVTSDNGPDLSQDIRGGSSGLLRCGKGSTWEGGMRVPGIAWWPSKIRHSRTHQMGSSLDLLPTIFNMAGVSVPEGVAIDGVDLSDLLYFKNGRSKRKWFAYFPEMANETQGPYAIRWRQYKAHFYTMGGLCRNDYPDVVCRYNTSLEYHNPPLLYNLHADPGEIYNLDPDHYSKVIERLSLIRQAFLYDLDWAGSQLLVGQDDNVQPCAYPGCEPFPYCCRSNQLSPYQSRAWL